MNPIERLVARLRAVELTHDLSTLDDRPAVEELVGSIDATEEQSTLASYRNAVEEYLLAPARIAWSDWRFKFGSLVVGLFLFMSTIWHRMYDQALLGSAPILAKPFNWQYTHEVFGIRIWQYPLGTTQNGQDILQRIVNASPMMLELIVAGAVVSIALAVVIGVTAGYKGGFIDRVLMTITDVVMTIPGLPLIILLAAIIEPRDPFVLGMLLAIDNWPGLARSLRSQVLTIRQESYVEASRAMGVSTGTILGLDIIPQLMPFILIKAAGAGKGVITEAVGLYFLGFLSTSAPNWGRMMDDAYQYGAISNPELFYLILWPMVVLALLSFGLVLLSQGLDQIFNPRLRARHIKRGEDSDEELDPTNV